MSFVSVPLGHLAEINPPAPRLHSDERVSFLPMAHAHENGTISIEEYRRQAEVKTGYTAFADSDVLVAKVTPCFENKKIVHARLPTKFGYGSTEFHVARAGEELDPRFLLHFLRQDWVRRAGQRRMTGSGGQRRVPKSFLEELLVPKFPMPEQRRIAAILDQADAVRRLRRDSLDRLANLGQAVFYEMFGDPATNPKGFARMRLGDTALVFSDGPFGSNLKSSHYVEQGVRVIRLQNIGVGELIDKDKAFVSPAHFAKLRKHRCIPGDVLVGTLGEPNLRACIQPIWLEEALNKADCVQIRTNPKVATNSFICALLNVPSVEMMAHSIVQGQTRARISMGRLRELVVPVPPIREQERFSDLMNTLADQKKEVVAAIEQADALFASLQHRAFRGEL